MKNYFIPSVKRVNHLPINSVATSSVPKRYQQQLSLPVCLLPGIHLTLPTETIVEHHRRYWEACLVCIQSPSNKSQVGLRTLKLSMRGWRISLAQGGLVII